METDKRFKRSSVSTQTSNNVEISLPAILLTLLSPQLLPDLAVSCPLRMLRISLLIKLAQAMACSVLLLLMELLLVELVLLLLPCSVMIVLLRVSCVSLFVLLVLMIFERV